MTKSQNTKNDLCITSEQLTEQWKSGWYWVELKEGTFADGEKSMVLDYFSELTNSFERHPYLVEQVLAPVPSYEEHERILVENDSLKQIRDELDCTVTQLREDKIELEEKNTQLKDLLKEIRGKIKTIYDIDQREFITSAVFTDEFVKKIDEVLNAR